MEGANPIPHLVLPISVTCLPPVVAGGDLTKSQTLGYPLWEVLYLLETEAIEFSGLEVRKLQPMS